MFCFLSPNQPIWDHVSYTGSMTDIPVSADIWVDCRSTYRSLFWSSVGWVLNKSWSSLGRVLNKSWQRSAMTCWSVCWLTLARLSTRPYSISIATNMLTDRQLRCQPIHENSPEFCNWSIWYLTQLICVMSNSVHHVSVDRYLVTKGKALGMRLEKQVVQVMSLTTNTPLIPYQFLTDSSLIHCRHTTNAITTDCQSICRPILDQQ